MHVLLIYFFSLFTQNRATGHGMVLKREAEEINDLDILSLLCRLAVLVMLGEGLEEAVGK